MNWKEFFNKVYFILLAVVLVVSLIYNYTTAHICTTGKGCGPDWTIIPILTLGHLIVFTIIYGIIFFIIRKSKK